MTPGTYRDPNALELAAIRKWRKVILLSRKKMEAFLAGAAACAYAEQFRRAQAPKTTTVVFTSEDQKLVQRICEAASYIERAYAHCEMGRWGIKLRPDGDLDVLKPNEDKESPAFVPPAGFKFPAPGVEMDLGAFWVPLIILAIVIGGAVVTTKSINYYAEQGAQNAQKALAKLNAEMATQPEDVRAAWLAFQKANPYAQEKGLLDRLLGSVGDVAPIILIALLAFAFMGKAGKATVATVQQNPRRRRARRNPCGGEFSPPESWRVHWSKDPDKRERQLGHVLGQLHKPKMDQWEGWFGYQ